MKVLVRKCLRRLGYEIRRIPRANGATLHGAGSAVAHNSRETRERFYADAGEVAAYLTGERRRFYRDVTALLEREVPALRTASLRIADYGCGPGLLLRHLAGVSPGSVFHGYDFTLAGIRVARENFPAATFAQRDLYDAFVDRYDLILCTEVLEHLEHPRRALANLLDQLAPGGRLLLTVPDGRVDQFAGHIHFWSPESWRLFVEEACTGLPARTGSISVAGAHPFLYALVGARP